MGDIVTFYDDHYAQRGRKGREGRREKLVSIKLRLNGANT